MALKIDILDKTRKKIGVLDRFRDVKAEKKKNEISNLSVSVLEDDIKTPLLQYGTMLQVFKNDADFCTYLIKERDAKKDARVITITGESEETLLTNIVIPYDYLEALTQDSSIQAVLGKLRYNYHSLRIKTPTQWADAYYAKSQIDYTTIPGALILAKEAGSLYYLLGDIIVQFDKADIPGFIQWDRIRWYSSLDATVETGIQVSHNGSGSYSTYTDEVTGLNPDKVGWPVLGMASLGNNAHLADNVRVRINLRTSDATVTPVVNYVEMIAQTQSGILATSLNAATASVGVLQANSRTAYDLIKAACENADWQFWVRGGTLYAAPQLGKDRSDDVLVTTGAIW